MRMRAWPWALIAVVACMPEIIRHEVAFRPSAPGDRPVVCLAEDASVTPEVGLTEDLARGSCWRRVGAIAQGDVYRPEGAVLNLTGANAHEAYLVVDQADAVGFYLPGESAFAPARARTKVRLQAKGE